MKLLSLHNWELGRIFTNFQINFKQKKKRKMDNLGQTIIGMVSTALIFIIIIFFIFWYKQRWIPKGYPKTLIVDLNRLYQAPWRISGVTGKVYIVPPTCYNPNLKHLDWNLSTFYDDNNGTITEGDFIIYPNKSAKALAFYVFNVIIEARGNNKNPRRIYYTNFLGEFSYGDINSNGKEHFKVFN